MENVATMAKLRKVDRVLKRAIDFVMEDLRKAGYEASWVQVNSLEFGIPQRRNRVWMIGIRPKAEMAVAR